MKKQTIVKDIIGNIGIAKDKVFKVASEGVQEGVDSTKKLIAIKKAERQIKADKDKLDNYLKYDDVRGVVARDMSARMDYLANHTKLNEIEETVSTAELFIAATNPNCRKESDAFNRQQKQLEESVLNKIYDISATAFECFVEIVRNYNEEGTSKDI